MGLNYEVHKQWLDTPKGRASSLLNAYNHKDLKQGRGKGNLTSQWIVDNILFKPCAHCGKKGWDVIGCNRLDNSKPHTMDNVEPCCKECNDMLAGKGIYQVLQIDKNTGEVLATFSSIAEVEKLFKYDGGNISKCCNGHSKTAYGYTWKRA